ncbi:putative cysteine-rich receptor-like protein kinase 20 [Bidens hawaiensis]|uniref:putative cysteine-rich receptor-like protein kinase 20 n=1 Tax=Bidens hawaiensis TaxID=980011 RepID=UPI00404A7FAA
MKEASILVKLEHENVIQLLGYCIDGIKVYLIYDFAISATLDALNSDPMCSLLDWNKRYKIILGVARALVYLHNHAPIRTKHRDVISKNILLDASFDPKLSGFVFATTITEPDCIPTTKADVYNFGVLVLETITGQRIFDPKRKANNDDVEITSYVKIKWLEGTLSDISDPRIDTDSTLMTKLIEIGLLCVQRDNVVRPTMEEVVDMLLGTSSLTLPVSEMRTRMNGEILRSKVVYD